MVLFEPVYDCVEIDGQPERLLEPARVVMLDELGSISGITVRIFSLTYLQSHVFVGDDEQDPRLFHLPP